MRSFYVTAKINEWETFKIKDIPIYKNSFCINEHDSSQISIKKTITKKQTTTNVIEHKGEKKKKERSKVIKY